MPEQPVPGQPSTPGGPDPARWPDRDWPGDEDWPNETNLAFPWPDPEIPWPGTEPAQPPSWQRRAAGLAVVAVVAAGAGVGLALSFGGSGGGASPAAVNSPSSASPGPSSGTVVPGQGGGPAGGQGGSTTGPGGSVTQMFLIGQITAVSGTSITIGGNGPAITAAITSGTAVTGNVHSVASLAVGDRVSAEITVSNGKAVAAAIQDPAQQQPPPLGSVP